MDVGDIRNIEYDSNQFFALKEKGLKLKNHLGAGCTDKNKNELEQELNEILSLTFLKYSSLENIDLHQTQIFDNDNRYNKLFELLTSFEELFELDLLNNCDKILIKETHKLYEYWLLAKMVHVLIIEQGWNTKAVYINNNPIVPIDNCSIIKAIGEALSLESSKGRNKKSISIILEHPSEMKIKIEFNATLDNTNLTPDFFIEVTSKDNKDNKDNVKCFVLDAKYRDYDDMEEIMGEEPFYRDIRDVCKEKYLTRLNNHWEKIHKKNTAAFIVSNGSRNEKESIESKWNYWGGTTDDRIEQREYSNPEHRYGSFVCCPGVESNGLKKFFEMIFEYHMNKWDVCWNCGHVLTNDDKKLKYQRNFSYNDTIFDEMGIPRSIKKTRSATIYHCTCTECDEFWVKSYCGGGLADLLVKHYDNYHTEVDDGYNWYVECPKCGDF